MKSILSFFSISFNEHSLYDLKNPKMDSKYLKRTDFGKIKFYVAKKKKKKKKSTYKSLQPCRLVSVPVSLIAFRRTVNGTAFRRSSLRMLVQIKYKL